MVNLTKTLVQTPDTPTVITPEMVVKNPALAAVGLFAGDPYWLELMAEIKREWARQRRRHRQSMLQL